MPTKRIARRRTVRVRVKRRIKTTTTRRVVRRR